MRLSEIVGQEDFKARIAARVAVSQSRGWPFPHLLISGGEGMGRWTIANAVASEVAPPDRISTATKVEKPVDMNGILTNVETGDCFVVRNIDGMDASILRNFTAVFERGQLEIQIGAGPGARTHTMSLPRFTIIATCENSKFLPAAIRKSVSLEELAPYSRDEISRIATNQAREFGFGLDESAAALATNSVDSSPSSICALLRRVTPYAGNKILTYADLLSILDVLGVNPKRHRTGSGLVEELTSMSGVEFERWSAALFTKHGYNVKTTKAAGDHGIDLEMGRNGRRVVVQCKRWTDPVGEPHIRDFYGAMLSAKADSGVFATTSSFTIQARQFADQKPITLLDLKSLLNIFLYGGAIEVAE